MAGRLGQGVSGGVGPETRLARHSGPARLNRLERYEHLGGS